MVFEDLNLNRPLLNALADLELETPTPIQEKAFPVIMSGKDVVGIAQTGTGKTFAYLLPILRQLKFSKEIHPRVLIIVPTRELVMQVQEEIEKLTAYMSIRTVGVYGGASINTQKQILFQGLDVLVATPRRLYDLSVSGAVKLKKVQKLVLDEVDEMLEMGFRHQLTSVLDLLPERKQNIMFSATMTVDVAQVIDIFFASPQRIEITPTGTPVEKINQLAYRVPNFYTKINFLEELLAKADMKKVLVFTRNKKLADDMFERLDEHFPNEIGVLHSNKSQNLRFNTIKRFEDGTHRILIATDVIARGMDIQEVSHVICMDVPEIPENYIHRIGRTGRAEELGTSIIMITEQEEELFEAIEQLMDKKVDRLPLPDEIEVSERLLTSEQDPDAFDIDYLGHTAQKPPHPEAFHEKKEKNKKENWGGPGKRNPKKTKPVNRGRLKRKFRKKK